MHIKIFHAHSAQAGNKGTRFFACVCDMSGQSRGKRLAIDLIHKATADNIRMALSAAGVDIWGTEVIESGLTVESGNLNGVCRPIGPGPMNILAGDPSTFLLPMPLGRAIGNHLLSLRMWFYQLRDARKPITTAQIRQDFA